MGPAHQDLMPSGERDRAPDRVGPKLFREALPGVTEGLEVYGVESEGQKDGCCPLERLLGCSVGSVLEE